MAKSKVVVFGNRTWADVADVYLTHDSPHEVVAFTIDGECLQEKEHRGRPLVAFEELSRHYPPGEFQMFIPISFKRMNHLRAEKYDQAKSLGYKLISYVSSKATTWPGFTCGDNCFILEDNTIQPFTQIGNDVVLWSGNHVGHHSVVKDHVMVTSQVVISGGCVIEPYCFLGVNATIRDDTVIARETLVGAGVIILRDTKEFEVYKAAPAQPAGFRSDELRSITHKS